MNVSCRIGFGAINHRISFSGRISGRRTGSGGAPPRSQTRGRPGVRGMKPRPPGVEPAGRLSTLGRRRIHVVVASHHARRPALRARTRGQQPAADHASPSPRARRLGADPRRGFRPQPLGAEASAGPRRGRRLSSATGHRGRRYRRRRPGRQRLAPRAEGRRDDGRHGPHLRRRLRRVRLVPLAQVIPVDTDLSWEVLGALPRWCRPPTVRSPSDWTCSRSVRTDPRRTSSVGLAAAALARWRGATVLSTTRQAGRLARLKEHGVDHPLLAPAGSRPSYASCTRAASTPRWISSAPRPCPTRCARCACTVRPASAAASPTSGRSGTSLRTSTCRGAFAWPATPVTPRTCRGRPSRRSWTRSPPAGWPSPWTVSTTAWSRCRQDDTRRHGA